MDANDLPSAAVHLAERRDKRGIGRTQPGNLYISSTAMCQQRKHSRPPKVGSGWRGVGPATGMVT
jgi:hypothetical protein